MISSTKTKAGLSAGLATRRTRVTAVAAGSSRTLRRSDDVIIGLHVLSETEAFAVGSSSPGGSGSFYHTNDAGATWTTSPLPSQYSLSSIFARPSRKVWASGSDGTVLHNPSFTAPLPALLLTLNPTYIIGGSPVQGTIRLGNPAPAGGATVTLSSGNPSLVGVPSSVVMPAGATSATFTVTTQPVNQDPSRVGITATYNGRRARPIWFWRRLAFVAFRFRHRTNTSAPAVAPSSCMCLHPLAVPGRLAQTTVLLLSRMAIPASATARLPWRCSLKRLVWHASARPSSPEIISASIKRPWAVARTRWPLRAKPLDSAAVTDRSR